MKVYVPAVVLALLLAGCATSPPGPSEPEMIAGGWSSAPVSSPEVQAVARFALNSMSAPGRALSRIDSASTQVVAGLNYRLDLTLSDGAHWRVAVYRDLTGNLTLTSAAALPSPGARD